MAIPDKPDHQKGVEANWNGSVGGGDRQGPLLVAPRGRHVHGDPRPILGANLTSTGGGGGFNLSAAAPEGRYLRRAL